MVVDLNDPETTSQERLGKTLDQNLLDTNPTTKRKFCTKKIPDRKSTMISKDKYSRENNYEKRNEPHTRIQVEEVQVLLFTVVPPSTFFPNPSRPIETTN